MNTVTEYAKKWFLAMLLIAFVAGCGGGGGGNGGGNPDVTAPLVSSTGPSDLAAGVPLNIAVTATFNEEMSAATLNETTFTLTQGSVSVSGAVTYAGTTATFTPTGNLAASTAYTATITTGAKDVAGNALAAVYTWTFITGTSADTTAPIVSSTFPVNLETGVALNSAVSVIFSEPMSAETLTAGTFTVKQGSTPVAGTVTYAGTTATFTPAANFTIGTIYTATITSGVKDLAGNALATNYVWNFSTGTAAETTPPTVSSTTPLNAATGVVLNITLHATFSEAISASTLTATTFTLATGTTPVPGTVTYDGTTASFNPTANLAAGTLYTATITTGVKDLAGNALAANYVWSFTTGAALDTVAPTVSYTVPLDGATGVAINGSVNAAFSETMNAATLNASTFTLMQGSTPVSGTVTYAGAIATFNPAASLASSTTYTATITTGAKDLAGNGLAANTVWSFRTGAAPDTTAPLVSSTNPANAAIGVPVNSNIVATFSEVMRATTLTDATFILMQGTTPVPAAVTCVGTKATLNPTSNLAASTLYTATITIGAKDLAGNALAVNKIWSFTTGTVAAAGPAPVVLGTAENYVILAKAAISTTGTTAVTGDLGLSPSAASFITGFSLIADSTNVFSTSSLVTGHIFAADYADPTPANLTTAVLDMMTAYTDAAGRAPDVTELGSGNIGGMTLAPGTYKWSSGVSIPSDLTLSGGPNDVWIFEIAQDLVMSSGTRINLLGNAQAKNIFWQVFGIVDLGTTAHFEGIALVQTAITLRTGATVNGRLLAQTAVTLDANAVVQPAP